MHIRFSLFWSSNQIHLIHQPIPRFLQYWKYRTFESFLDILRMQELMIIQKLMIPFQEHWKNNWLCFPYLRIDKGPHWQAVYFSKQWNWVRRQSFQVCLGDIIWQTISYCLTDLTKNGWIRSFQIKNFIKIHIPKLYFHFNEKECFPCTCIELTLNWFRQFQLPVFENFATSGLS